MAWIVLLVAGLFEVVWATALPRVGEPRGFAVVAVALVISVALLAYATRTVPVGTAYAVWVGIGAVGTAVVDALRRGEALDPVRVLCLALVIVGVVGLELRAPASGPPSAPAAGGGASADPAAAPRNVGFPA